MIWTASDHGLGLTAALRAHDETAYATLSSHGIHANHCGGYDVLAWPCPTAAQVLDRLLGGAALLRQVARETCDEVMCDPENTADVFARAVGRILRDLADDMDRIGSKNVWSGYIRERADEFGGGT